MGAFDTFNFRGNFTLKNKFFSLKKRLIKVTLKRHEFIRKNKILSVGKPKFFDQI